MSIFLTIKNIYLSVLKEHKVTSLTTVSVVGITFALLFICLLIGYAIINNAESKLDPSLVKRIIVVPSDDEGILHGVTESMLEEFRKQSEVRSAFELYVILADIQAEDSSLRKEGVEVESVEGDDLIFLPERFIAGNQICSSDELVLDKLLADSLQIYAPGRGVVLQLQRTRH